MTDEAFQQAVEQYGDMIFRLAFSYLKNRADAEDVMQETLLKLYTRAPAFASEDNRRFWLVRVAVNESKKLLRSPWRRRISPLEELAESTAFDTPAQSGLFQHVMSLPPKYRAAVYLHYYEGYTAVEIGRLLHRNVNTVYTLLARAKEQLREKLGGDGYEG